MRRNRNHYLIPTSIRAFAYTQICYFPINEYILYWWKFQMKYSEQCHQHITPKFLKQTDKLQVFNLIYWEVLWKQNLFIACFVLPSPLHSPAQPFFMGRLPLQLIFYITACTTNLAPAALKAISRKPILNLYKNLWHRKIIFEHSIFNNVFRQIFSMSSIYNYRIFWFIGQHISRFKKTLYKLIQKLNFYL